jgi:hypothetical protein
MAGIGVWDGPTSLSSSSEPRSFRSLDPSHGLLGGSSECGARLKVGDVGDLATVLVAVENVDVEVVQRSSTVKAYGATSRRDCRSWYGFT